MRLYTFPTCPFVERITIILIEKSIACEQVAIDLRNKPQWFADLTPEATVPMLEVASKDKKTLHLSESIVIADYLDEISADSLYPANPEQKAYNKLWIERASKIIFSTHHMYLAKDNNTFNEKKRLVDAKLTHLETEIINKPYFNGEQFSMVDAAYAPYFRRLECLNKLCRIDLLKPYTNLQTWAEKLLSRSSVKLVKADNYDEAFLRLLKLKESILAK